MCLYRRVSLLLISLLWMLLPAKTLAQPLFPAQAGDKVRYTAYIEMPKAYISGLCIMANDGQREAFRQKLEGDMKGIAGIKSEKKR